MYQKLLIHWSRFEWKVINSLMKILQTREPTRCHIKAEAYLTNNTGFQQEADIRAAPLMEWCTPLSYALMPKKWGTVPTQV